MSRLISWTCPCCGIESEAEVDIEPYDPGGYWDPPSGGGAEVTSEITRCPSADDPSISDDERCDYATKPYPPEVLKRIIEGIEASALEPDDPPEPEFDDRGDDDYRYGPFD